MNTTPSREEALFRAAAALAGTERAAYLDQACAGNAALRARLDALLAAHDQPDTLPGEPADAARPTIRLEFAEAPDEAVGQTIGRYKLLEKIGEGGCGVVYVAEQTEPVRRRVALKVIKLGMDTREVIARFEAERQALAMMDHPNIAKVLDAGMVGEKSEVRIEKPGDPNLLTPDSRVLAPRSGRPYFVMELVRGIKITDYCDQNNLSTRERLDLFNPGLSCDPACPPEGHHPSRHQAVERPVDVARRRAGAEGDRFRHRQGHRPEADRPDGLHPIRCVHRHAGLHEPGAGGVERAGHRHAVGHLQPGGVAV